MSTARRHSGVRLPSLGLALVLAAAVTGTVLLWSEFRDPTMGGGGPPPQTDPIGTLQAVESLVRLGDEAVPELVAMLSSPNPVERRYALFGLGRFGRTIGHILPSVGERLADEDSKVRRAALEAHSQICDDPDERLAFAARMMTDSDHEVRRSAYVLVQKCGARAIPKLIELRRAEPAEVRAQVIRFLKPFRTTAVTETLRSLLDDADEGVRGNAIEAVVKRDAGRPDELPEWLNESNPKVVDETLGAIERMGPAASAALPALEALLESSEPKRLNAVLSSLQALKGEARPAIPSVLRRVAKLQGSLRTRGCECLLEIGADPADVVPLLTPLFAREYVPQEQYIHAWPYFAGNLLARASPEEARQQAAKLVSEMERDKAAITVPAIEALSGIGPQAREAVPLLTRLARQELVERDSWIRQRSITALGSIGPDAAPAVPALMALLDRADTGYGIYESVLKSLGKIGPGSPSVVPKLLEIIDPPGPASDRSRNVAAWWPSLQIDAIRALGQIGDNSPEVLAVLRRRAATHDSLAPINRRHMALQSLIQLDGNSAATLADLVRALDDGSGQVRLFAALALARLNPDDQEVIDRLATALGDEDPYVQTAVALALRKIGPAGKAAVPALRNIVRDEKNSASNEDRIGRGFYADPNLMQLVVHQVDLPRISVAEAAQMALETIESSGAAASAK